MSKKINLKKSNEHEVDKSKGGIKNIMHRVKWFIIGSVVGIVVFSMVTAILSAISLKEKFSDFLESDTSETSDVITSDTTDNTSGQINVERITLNEKDSRAEAVNRINSVFSYIKDKSFYIQVEAGNGDNEYDSYMYSKNGELVAQSYDGSYSIVMRNDMQSVKYDNSNYTIAFNSVLDVIGTAKGAVRAIEDNTDNTTITRIKLEGDEEYGVYEYAIDFYGKEACKKLFSEYGEDFASSLIDEIALHMGESWEPHLVFGITVNDEKQLGLYLDIVEGDNEYNNWLCNYYVVTEDWQLEDSWYTVEFNEENSEELLKMMETELNKLNEIASKMDSSLFDNASEYNSEESNATEVEAEREQEYTNKVYEEDNVLEVTARDILLLAENKNFDGLPFNAATKEIYEVYNDKLVTISGTIYDIQNYGGEYTIYLDSDDKGYNYVGADTTLVVYCKVKDIADYEIGQSVSVTGIAKCYTYAVIVEEN